jgi:PAS domain S-box-containing protein
MTTGASGGRNLEYARVLEVTPARLYLFDRSGALRFVTRAAAEALGAPASALVGRTLAELGASRPLFVEMERARPWVCASCAPLAVEVSVPRGDELEVFHCDLRPLEVEGGEARTVLCTVTDVTELRAAQRAEQRVRRQLQDALTRVLSGFVRLCSECYAVSSDTEWVPLEKYLHRRDPARLSHGYCDDCYRRALLQIGGSTRLGDE